MCFEKAVFFDIEQVLALITRSLQEKRPFSMIRLSEAPNLILAQETIYPLEELMKFKYVRRYNARKETGFVFPNLEARDLMAKALRSATIVGILPYNDDRIASSHWMKRPLTDQVLKFYDFKPELICDACINREMPARTEFWQVLSNKRVLLISAWADLFARVLMSKKFSGFNIKIAGKIPMFHYKDICRVVGGVKEYDFDCILMTCGVNANIIGPAIAHKYNTVVVNLGKSMRFIVENKTGPGMPPYYLGRAANSKYIFLKGEKNNAV